MQRKVSRVSGYKTAAETKALQKQIKELQAVGNRPIQHLPFIPSSWLTCLLLTPPARRNWLFSHVVFYN